MTNNHVHVLITLAAVLQYTMHTLVHDVVNRCAQWNTRRVNVMGLTITSKKTGQPASPAQWQLWSSSLLSAALWLG